MPTPKPKDATISTDAERAALADELLAVRCQLGEREAFDALVDRWHGPLCRYVRRRIDDPDDSAETVQELWLRVLRGIPRLRHPERLRSWLFGIARRTVMDRRRKQYAGPSLADEIVVDELVGDTSALPASPASPGVRTEAVRDAVAALPLLEREVVELFYLQQLSLREAADVLGVPEGTVKSRLHRARGLLRTRLEDQGALS
jgi:RNA polymerase sigma-70 factor (ECF subfamily)